MLINITSYLKRIVFSFFVLSIICEQSLVAQQEISIIPKPMELTQSKGSFRIRSNTKIIYSGKPAAYVASYLGLELYKSTGYRLAKAKSGGGTNCIRLSIKSSVGLGKEGYSLAVTPNHITIVGNDPAGLFYGVQTVKQLLPATSFSIKRTKGKWLVPCVKVKDKPRFVWRGMHLDVCRHFFSKEAVMKFIDILAMHKMNTLHWHLTEDQAWRIEIKKYPKLTEIGAWRSGIGFGLDTKDSTHFNKKGQYGGFYSQKDIKEIVKYARQRHVTIVPEIELPGHAMAALAAYPQFSCTGGPFKIPLSAGVFPDVYCPGKEATFKFLQDVLAEVTTLFPGEFVHIGGDECPKTRWKTCPDCQKRIKAEGLKDEHELQSYTIKRIEKFLMKRKKRLIGWDEILEGGLAPNAAVMSWRGMGGGAHAAKMGHDVVMTPTSHCYFDYGQAKEGEPRFMGGVVTLDRVYSFDPMPGGIPADKQKHVLGAQGTLWSEYFPNAKHLEYMTVPRICALAEVLWTPKKLKNWDDFTKRMQKQYKRMDAMDINYRKPRD